MTNQRDSMLLDYPFDLYQRTRDIQEIANIISTETGEIPLRILDVGGFRLDAEERENLLLREFLPQHRIVTLDLVSSSIPGYVQGDGTHLPFKNQTFDVTISSDVYEHIPPDLRKNFLDNLVQVTRADGFIILGAPFYSEKTALAESIVFEYVRKILLVEHSQLKEHIQNRLPDAKDLETFLQGIGLDYISFDSGYLDNWLLMMMVKHYLMTVPGSRDFHSLLDRFYNMSRYEKDHQPPGYRKIFIIAKAKTSAGVLDKIRAHFAAYADADKKPTPEHPDLNAAHLLMSLEELKTHTVFQEKDRIIQAQAAQIEALNRMQSTRVYKFLIGLNKIFFKPPVGVLRFIAAKFQQAFRVLTGKRKHPLLSLSGWLYRRWFKKHTPTGQEFETLRKECRQWSYLPVISIVMPVYNTKSQWLVEAIASVKNQVYEKWELCVVDDGSSEKHVQEILDREKNRDPRIKVKHLPRNRGIALASNQALAMAAGAFIAFMDSDDVLHPMALFEAAKFLNRHPDADLIFTDEDKLTLQGVREKPVFKPGWSPDLFLTYNYINHLTLCRKKLVDEAGGFRPEYTWSQDYDLYLRITEKTGKIFHIPKVLYHWRAVPGSSAYKVDFRTEALAKNMELLTETLRRRGIPGIVVKGLRPGTFKIKKNSTVASGGQKPFREKVSGLPKASDKGNKNL